MKHTGTICAYVCLRLHCDFLLHRFCECLWLRCFQMRCVYLLPTCIEFFLPMGHPESMFASNFSQVSKSYKGVKVSSGQELFSQKLVLDPSFRVPSGLENSSSDIVQKSSVIFGSNHINQKVARGICIAKTTLKPDVSSCLVFFTPRCEISILSE